MQARVFVLVSDRLLEILDGLVDLSIFELKLGEDEIVIRGWVGRGGFCLNRLGLLNWGRARRL
jgi:hypothetical protein